MSRLPDLEKLRAHAQAKLTPQRYRHSVAVQKRAAELARRYGVDWYKAAVAGLLHDICHDMDKAAQLNYIKSCGILLDDLALENPPVWHAVAGTQYARRVLGIRDRGILGAIRCHTTGRAGMTALEKVVYVADLTSEDRVFPDIERVRAISNRSLDAAVLYSLRYTNEKLIRCGRPLVREGWEAYNYYVLHVDSDLIKEPEG